MTCMTENKLKTLFLSNPNSSPFLEMLSQADEDSYPDLGTVTRTLSADAHMLPLPPGGGLYSK